MDALQTVGTLMKLPVFIDGSALCQPLSLGDIVSSARLIIRILSTAQNLESFFLLLGKVQLRTKCKAIQSSDTPKVYLFVLFKMAEIRAGLPS